MFDLSVYYMFLQYFDTVGWVFWPVKTVSYITYTVLAEWQGRKTLLNPIQSPNNKLWSCSILQKTKEIALCTCHRKFIKSGVNIETQSRNVA